MAPALSERQGVGDLTIYRFDHFSVGPFIDLIISLLDYGQIKK